MKYNWFLFLAIISMIISCNSQNISGEWNIAETLTEESDGGQMSMDGHYAFTEVTKNAGDLVLSIKGVITIDMMGDLNFSFITPDIILKTGMT
ncbi:MAG: hypothetical protein IJ151_01785 [Bacteroidales bacterium]|nr:hypothetical protein [Bacteroidales bacterium]